MPFGQQMIEKNLNKYIHRLPLGRVHEIHINGWAEKDGQIMWHIKINNEAKDEIVEQVNKLRESIGR